MSLLTDKLLRSMMAKCWRRGQVPSKMTSVFLSIIQLMRCTAMHSSTIILASCASATGTDANSCLSSAKMWYWMWYAQKMTTSLNWTGLSIQPYRTLHVTGMGADSLPLTVMTCVRMFRYEWNHFRASCFTRNQWRRTFARKGLASHTIDLMT